MSFDEEIRFQYLGRNPSLHAPVLSLIACSIIFNSIIFYILPSTITPLKKSYIVSTVHALASVLAATLFYLFSTINLKQVNRIVGGGILATHDEKMVYSLCYSCGYFIYDIIIMLLFKSVRNRSALIHHVIIASSVLAGLYTGIGHSCHFFFLMEELSTIPLNLKTLWNSTVRLHKSFNVLFIASFLFSRLIYGTIIFLYIFRAIPIFIQMASRAHDYISIVIIFIQGILCILTRILNVYWTILIVRKTFSMLQVNQRYTPMQQKEHDQKTQ
ncbi:unnamed protein product [Rotaria magnacalcarata]|nr:unnamed protein product [Rotaria magnacalcarata]